MIKEIALAATWHACFTHIIKIKSEIENSTENRDFLIGSVEIAAVSVP